MGADIQALVVEDEPAIRTLLQYNLKLDGFNVTTAEDGPTGLQTARYCNPNLILLDVMMPGMTGLEVLAELKKEKKFQEIPIFMLTAKAMMGDIDHAFELGADDYITKPFDPIKLGQIIKEKMEKYKKKKKG